MKDNRLRDIFMQFIDQFQSRNGMLVFDAPTGLGKTTAAGMAIQKYIEEDTFKRVFYITNLKKNLPIKQMKELFGSDYDKYCLFLDSTTDALLENWIQTTDNIPERIKKEETYGNLNDEIRLYTTYSNKKKTVDKEERKNLNKVIKMLETSIKDTRVPAFKKRVKDIYFSNEQYPERKKILQENPWISDIFPTSKLEDYKVIMMSVDRFLYPIDPLYKNSYNIINDPIIDKSLVIIDEIDSVKENIIDFIIEDGINTDTDLVDLFLHIERVLAQTSFSEEFYRPSKKAGQISIKNMGDHPDIKKINAIENKIEALIEYNRYRFSNLLEELEINHFLKSDFTSKEKGFLFNDGHEIDLTRKNTKKQLYYKLSNDEKVLKIEQLSKKDIRGHEKVQELMIKIRGLISYFTNTIKILVNNLIALNEEKENILQDERFSLDSAINTVFSSLSLKNEHKTFMYNQLHKIMFKKGKMGLKRNEEFYTDGFYFIEAEDSIDHAHLTTLRMFDFYTSPEEVLAQIATKSIVVGMSATATLKTVTGNFNLDVIKKRLEKLGCIYLELSNQTSEELNQLFLESQKLYHQKKVGAQFSIVDTEYDHNDIQFIEKLFFEIFRDTSYFKKHLDNRKDNSSDYYTIRMLKLLKVYKDFSYKDEQSIIVFLNAFPSNNSFTMDQFDEYRQILEQTQNIKYYDIRILRTLDYDSDKEEIDILLEEGKKVMVLTTYQTIGIGKNIQYQLTTDMEKFVVQTSSEIEREKDFDAIYLTEKTGIIPGANNNNDNERYKSIAQQIFYLEYLVKSKSIYSYEFERSINQLFKRYFLGNTQARITARNVDYSKYVSKIIIQSIGRLCRSRYINKQTYIYLDSDMYLALNEEKEELEKRNLPFQVKHILDGASNYKYEDRYNEINTRNYSLSVLINSKSNTVRSSRESISSWKELRKYLLKNPTIDQPDEKYKHYYYDFGEKTSSYSYLVGGNQRIVKIIRGKSFYKYNVSGNESGLDDLMENEVIKNHFIKQGYATRFEKKQFILMPAAFQQIYKGALGEEAGKAILESYFNEPMEDIKNPEIFEFFDYEYKNIFIDFKNWQNYDKKGKAAEAYTNTVLRKLEKGKKEYAIIINIFKTGENLNLNSRLGIVKIPHLLDSRKQIIDEQIQEILKYLK